MSICSIRGRTLSAFVVVLCHPVLGNWQPENPSRHAPEAISDRVVVQFRSAELASSVIAGWDADQAIDPPAPDDGEDAGGEAARRIHQILGIHGARRVEGVFVGAPGDPDLASNLGLDRMVIVNTERGLAGSLADAIAQVHDEVARVERVNLGRTLGDPPNDPLFSTQYGLRNAHNAGADIHAIGAWRRTTGSRDITIAIVDTGISRSHQDLAPNLLAGHNFSSGNPEDSDDSTFVSHGTSVAGVAGAVGGNGTGIAGTCWDVRLLPVRVANRYGITSDAQVASGIVWAADQGARVINVSLGFSSAGSVLEAAVEYAIGRGALVCAAAGNSPGMPILAPARYSGVVCVGATDQNDLVPSFVTTGPEMSICAPGVEIVTTEDTTGNPDGYSTGTGTSLACPFVAAAAALVWSVNPELSSQQVRYVLIATADDMGAPGWDEMYGWGRLNAERAVELADPHPQPACEVDWNENGVVDSEDFFSFVDDYLELNADFNNDGLTDSADFFGFVVRFFVGC